MSLKKYETIPVSIDTYPSYKSFLDIPASWRFFSRGKSGTFELRVIIFRRNEDANQNQFTLGFGVWREEENDIDDIIQTRNDDTNKILATVADVALSFLIRYPKARLYCEGSTLSRTRLYQREIGKVIGSLPSGLAIYGVLQDGLIVEKFQARVNYEGFLLTAENELHDF